MSEVLEVEVVEDLMPETSKALEAQRTELAKVPGFALFMAALQAFHNESEQQVRIGLRGIKTFTVSAEATLNRRIDNEDDYKSCLSLALDAGKREKAVLDAFAMGTGFFYSFHRALTGLRSMGAGPWEKLKDKLARKAELWWLEQERLKQQAADKMAQASEKAKTELELKAEEAIACGYVDEGVALLREAQIAASPISLPDATPKFDGFRATPRWKITVTDVVAVAKAVAEGRVPLMHAVKVRGKKETEDRPLLVVDEAVLRALADRMGMELMRKVPGILVERDVSLSGTGRR